MKRKICAQSLVLLLLAFPLSGCFSFRFWFERLDTVAIFQLDRMFGLSEAQEDILRPELIAFKEWLRSATIPTLIDNLKVVKNLWDTEQQERALSTLEFSARESLDQVLIYSWPIVARLLPHLTRENAYAYQAWAAKRMDQWYAETLSATAKTEARTDALEERLGRLSKQQKAIVARHTSLFPEERIIRINSGQQRRQLFLTMAIEGDWKKLEKAYKEPDLLQSRSYLQWRTQEREQLQAMFRALVPTLSASQKQNISEILADWIIRLQSTIPDQ